ncbi:MAG: 16S rRNA (guanine(966)-N(2))-methyltransferase RsmD [Pseudomonadales bacterium]|nr:16S rRNA (guanine(966)-N(2))-methyltransferase RsmD [Pseudomonadales bacterium]
MAVKNTRNRYRIVAGTWRGRVLDFPAVKDLRPTPDRVRETLFNWLQSPVGGARCLDLFAGSGALGLEALSRGAASVTSLEINPDAAAALQANGRLLQASGLTLIKAEALAWLNQTPVQTPFDIVFLDPPYALNLLPGCCQTLESRGWLKPESFIYLEADSALEHVPLPPTWTLIKSKRAGQVFYGLCQRHGQLSLRSAPSGPA